MALVSNRFRKINWVSLIVDTDHKGRLKASIGKIAFWLTFLPAIWFWYTNPKDIDIQPSHVQTLMIVMSYNLLKKSPYFGGVKKNPVDLQDDEIDEQPAGEIGNRWKNSNKNDSETVSVKEGME